MSETESAAAAPPPVAAAESKPRRLWGHKKGAVTCCVASSARPGVVASSGEVGVSITLLVYSSENVAPYPWLGVLLGELLPGRPVVHERRPVVAVQGHGVFRWGHESNTSCAVGRWLIGARLGVLRHLLGPVANHAPIYLMLLLRWLHIELSVLPEQRAVPCVLLLAFSQRTGCNILCGISNTDDSFQCPVTIFSMKENYLVTILWGYATPHVTITTWSLCWKFWYDRVVGALLV